jgi:vitamin B12 transporter
LRHSQHDDLALGARLSLGPGSAHAQAIDLSFAERSRDRTSPAVPPIVPPSEEDVTYSRLHAGWRVPLVAGKRTALDLGASGDTEWARNVSVLHLPAFMGGDVSGNYDKSRGSAGVFTGLRQELGALTLESALRVDAATTDSLQVNPHLGLVWRIGRGDTRLRASGGRASKLASFTALASPKALGGNPDLKPERVLGGEIGVEQSLRPAKLDASLALFRQEYRNLVDFDLASFTYVNRSRVRTQGAELQLGFKPRATLRVEAELTWLDAKDLGGSLFLHAPRWVAGARLTWRPTARLDLRLDYRALTRYYDEQLAVPERDTVTGHALLGAAAAWRLNHGLTLRGRVDNLTNRRYENLIGFPGPRRSGWVGVSWERS